MMRQTLNPLKGPSIGVGVVDYNFRLTKNKTMKKIATRGILENIKEGKVSIYTFVYIETKTPRNMLYCFNIHRNTDKAFNI